MTWILKRGRFRFTERTYEKGSDSLRSLVADIDSARRSIAVVCRSCDLKRAKQDLVTELEAALVRAKERAVLAVFYTVERAPAILEAFADRRLLHIEVVDHEPSFYGRLVDGLPVEEHDDGALYQGGPYLRLERA